MSKKKKVGTSNISKTAIVLDVVAAILLLAFLLSFYNVTVYIMSLVEAGSISYGSDWLDIVLYYVNNTVIYLGLSAILYGMGYVVSFIKKQSVQVVEEIFIEEPVVLAKEKEESVVPTEETKVTLEDVTEE